MKIVFKNKTASGADWINAKDADPKKITRALKGKSYNDRFIQVKGIDDNDVWIDATTIAYITQDGKTL